MPAVPVINPVYQVEIEDSLESPSARLYYLICNTEDEAAAYALVQSILMPAYFGFYLTRYSLKHKGAGLWDVVVTYAGTLPQTDGTTAFELDFTAGTEKRRQSLQTTKYAPAGQTPPDFGGAINVHDGAVEGVEVSSPKQLVTVTKYFSVGNLLPNQIQAASDLAATVNDATFTLLLNNGQTLTAPAGCCLYMGAPIKQKGDEAWCFSWKFQFGAPQTYNITTPNGAIPAFQKLPFDYLWMIYQTAVSNGQTVKQPIFAFVEKVYPDGDFTLLGL